MRREVRGDAGVHVGSVRWGRSSWNNLLNQRTTQDLLCRLISSFVQRLPSGHVDSALKATSTIHVDSANLQPSAPLPCVESAPGQVNFGCAVDRHSQRAAWCLGRLVSALMFLDMQQVLESRQMASWHTQDHGRLQVHMCRRHESDHKNWDSKQFYWHPWNLRRRYKF